MAFLVGLPVVRNRRGPEDHSRLGEFRADRTRQAAERQADRTRQADRSLQVDSRLEGRSRRAVVPPLPASREAPATAALGLQAESATTWRQR